MFSYKKKNRFLKCSTSCDSGPCVHLVVEMPRALQTFPPRIQIMWHISVVTRVFGELSVEETADRMVWGFHFSL